MNFGGMQFSSTLSPYFWFWESIYCLLHVDCDSEVQALWEVKVVACAAQIGLPKGNVVVDLGVTVLAWKQVNHPMSLAAVGFLFVSRSSSAPFCFLIPNPNS